MRVRSHSHKDVTVVGQNVGAISLPRSHRPRKETVQVDIEWEKIQSGSHTPSFVARIHEPHLASFKAECKVNLLAVCIFPPKSIEPSKLLKGDFIPSPLSHPVNFSCVLSLLNIQSGKELSIVSLFQFLVKAMISFKCLASQAATTSSKTIMFSFHVVPVNPLGEGYRLVLRQDHRLIKFLLESHVKPVIKPNLLLNMSWVFFSSFPLPTLFCPYS
jgi:hypothetical protein